MRVKIVPAKILETIQAIQVGSTNLNLLEIHTPTFQASIPFSNIIYHDIHYQFSAFTHTLGCKL